ncbi:MAG: T9SS type A sorting domain-containing protein, partial [Flavobacteriales bacterium]|nr:T9SS type A sorting domain-containing protein [Flavobacteriales bacterium]
ADAYLWLDCEQEYLPLENEDNSFLHAPYDGSFAVMITEGACVDTTECATVIASGLNDLHGTQVDIFPNPVKDRLTIRNLPHGEMEWTILDISGRGVLNKQIQVFDRMTVVDTSDLPPGVYIIVILQDGIRHRSTFIKE